MNFLVSFLRRTRIILVVTRCHCRMHVNYLGWCVLGFEYRWSQNQNVTCRKNHPSITNTTRLVPVCDHFRWD